MTLAVGTEDQAKNPERISINEQIRLARREKRIIKFNKVNALHQEGLSIRQISRHLGIGRKTVRGYLSSDVFPEIAQRPKCEGMLAPYKAYLKTRWQSGITNGKQLWREIQEQGFTGTYQTMILFICELKKLYPPPPKAEKKQKNFSSASFPTEKQLSATRVSFMLIQSPDNLEEKLKTIVDKLLEESGEVKAA